VIWRIFSGIGALSFIVAGITILSAKNCERINFGGTARSSTYECLTEAQARSVEGTVPQSIGILVLLGGLLLALLALWPLLGLRRRPQVTYRPRPDAAFLPVNLATIPPPDPATRVDRERVADFPV
jgi:hypothetical protein